MKKKCSCPITICANFQHLSVFRSYVNKSSLLIYASALQQLLLVREDPHIGSLSSRNSRPYINITPTRGVPPHVPDGLQVVHRAARYYCDH